MLDFTIQNSIKQLKKIFFAKDRPEDDKIKILFLSLAAVLIFIPASFSHAVTVCKEGPPTCNETTIGGALYNTDYNGQDVTVGPGTYSESNLTVGTTSQGGPRKLISENPSSPGTTTINATGSNNPVINLYGGSEIRGFTITGGNGGIVTIGGSVLLQDLIIVDNDSTSSNVGGGGVRTNNTPTAITIIDCDIRNNKARGGGGGVWGLGSLTIKGGTIEGNKVFSDSNYGHARGGGVGISSYSPLVIEGTTIKDNILNGSTKNEGAGIYAYDTAKLTNVKILNNIANDGTYGSGGGGIYKSTPTQGGPWLYIIGGTISGNQADRGGGVYVGGTSRLRSSAAISNNIAREGIADTSGGGIYCGGLNTLESLAGTVNGNSPDQLAGCGANVTPPLGTTRTPADNKQSGDSNDPVNTFTGELYNQYDPDISLGGPMPLYFTRYYSSGFKQVGIFANMGDNWRHNFDWKLTAIGSSMHIVDHHGRTIQFDQNGFAWDLVGKTDIPYQLVENTGIYALLDPHNQHSYVFNSAGQLTSIADGRGNVHTLSYVNGPLTQVSDGLGRVLNFTYNVSNYLISVDDGLGREVGFAYTDSYLTGVADLTGNTTEYNYSTAHDNHLGMGLLASTVRPAGNTPFEHLEGVYSTAYNPLDGELYGLISKTIAEGGGLYPVTGPNRGILMQAYDRPSHVLFADNGNAFISESYAGVINRLEWQGSSSVWVSGFHDGDDDPFGMTFAPPDFNGPNVNPGDILVSDRGWNGPDEIYAFSPDTSEGEQLVMPDPGSVEVDFFDMAPGSPGVVYTCDYLDSNNIYTLAPDGTLTALPLSEPIPKMGGIVYDSVDNVMYVASSETMSVYRIDPATGQVVLVTSGFANLRLGCLEIDPPTRRLWVTDNGYNRIYEISLQATVSNITTYAYSQTYDGSSKVATQTDADGNTFSFDYSGLDTTITGPLGDTRVHTHTATGEFSNRQDQAGRSFSMGSDATGRRNSITDRLGDTTSVNYDPSSGMISSVTNADGTSKSYSYTARLSGGLTLYDITAITHADATTESFTYDVNGNLTSHTDQMGNSATATYNSNGQLLTATNVATGTITNTYNGDATLATSQDPGGNTTTLSYDSLRRLSQLTFDDSSTLQFTYDDEDRLLSSLDENSNTTTFSYDANGNIATITDPLSNTATFAYDGNDRLISVTNPLGNTASQSYSPLGKVTTITDKNSNITTLGYDILGRHITTTDPLGHVWSQSYDAEAILTSSTDPLGNTTSFTSDAMGRITQTSSPLGNISQIGYDTMGRIIATTDPLSRTTTFSYDSLGLLSGINLPGGSISTSYTRNKLGHITQVTDPNGYNWQSSFNNQGLRTSRTDPTNNVQTMVYDNRNRPAIVTYGDGAVRTVGYDPTGNLTSSNYNDGTLVFNYSYDDNNRLFSANDGPSTPDTLTQSYDKAGRISISNSIGIGRDPAGRIINMTLATGKSVTYSYDANDNLTSVTDWTGATTSFSFDNADRLIAIARPAANSVDTGYTYDNDSRLVGVIENRGATAVSSIALIRDAKGQITQATRNIPQSASAVTPFNIMHSFDAASQIATTGFVYDTRGRLTEDTTRSYTWDDASRLTSITEGAVVTTYTYDALRQRLSCSSSGVDRSYVWNTALGLNSISIERDGGGDDLRYFIHTPSGALLYSIDATDNAHRFYHFDEMGNTIAVTNDSGTVIAAYAYTPYGRIAASTGAQDNPFTWLGQYGVMDEGNGLYYVRARYYDADTGRFISRDPLKAIGPREINPYQYGLTNPLRFVDMTGKDSDTLEMLTQARDKLIVAKIKLKRAEEQYLLAYDASVNAERAFKSLLKSLSALDAPPWLGGVDVGIAQTRVKDADSLEDARWKSYDEAAFAFLEAQAAVDSAREAHRLHLRDILEKAKEKLRKAKHARDTGTRTKTDDPWGRWSKARREVKQAKEAFERAGGEKAGDNIESVIPELIPLGW